jgi:hypothetical protein
LIRPSLRWAPRQLAPKGLHRTNNLAQTLHRDPTSPRLVPGTANFNLANKMPVWDDWFNGPGVGVGYA